MNSKNRKLYYIALAFAALLIKLVPTDHTSVDVAQIEVYFTPGSPATEKIIERIQNAQKEILMQSYSFTSQPIADALIAAHNRGVKVMCIIDYSYKTKLLVMKVAQAQIPVYIDHPSGIAHNKVLIIDDLIVLTGSFNFTNAAQHRNVENSLHIVNSKIAAQYKKQWEERLSVSKKLASI